MLLDDKPYTFDRVFRLLVAAGGCAAAIWLMRYLSDVLIPFAAAFLLAYLLNPLVNRIQRRVRHRALAVFAALALVVMLLGAAGLLLVPMVRSEISQISTLMIQVAQDAALARRAAEYLPAGFWQQIQTLAGGDQAKRILVLLNQADLWALVQIAGQKVLPGIWGVIHGAASFLMGLLGLFVIVLYLVFMLLDYQRINSDWKSMIPAPWSGRSMEFLNEFNGAMSRYFRAQALVAFLVGVMFAVGFAVIGLPMAILLGLFIGLLNMVPYLQIIGLIPAGLLAVIRSVETGGSLWGILGLTLLVFVVVQLIQDAVLTPRIMGKVTGLSPAMILLSISIWGKLLGMLGLIIALPMTCLLLAYYRRLTNPGTTNS